MSPSPQLLWEPSPVHVEAAALTSFRRGIEERHGVDLGGYAALHRWSVEHPGAFWGSVWEFAGVLGDPGREPVLENPEAMPGARWFPRARLSFAENLLRLGRARSGPGGEPPGPQDEAIVFWSEEGTRRSLGWAELETAVFRTARALEAHGIGPGDRVAGYLPNTPETVVVALAAAALGATWSSCSPDFGAASVLDRFGQIEPRVLFATDGYRYGGRWHSVEERVAEVALGLPTLELLVRVPYAGLEGPDEAPRVDEPGRGAAGAASEVDLSDFVRGFDGAPMELERFPFDHPLYILFSSGTTGSPKCIVHGAGGTLLQHLKEHLLHGDIRPGDRLFYFTTCGWMMWNWLVSGLAAGATLLLYDGSPFAGDGSVLFDLADAERMTHFGTSAKFIDELKNRGLDPARTHDLSTLRAIYSTGSPLMPEGFDYVYSKVKRDVRLSSISGGTDIVSCFVLGSPTLPVRRGEIQCRGLGMAVEVFDEEGTPVVDEKGELVCTAPFPSMPLGFWDDPGGERYRDTYYRRYPGVWWHGDYAQLTPHGGVIIYGRSDTVLNPGGVRIGTAEIYRPVEEMEEIREAVVVGQEVGAGDVRVVLFVRTADDTELTGELVGRIEDRIREKASPRHVPAVVLAVPDIPRTRSGKVAELAVRAVVHGEPVTNRHALANPGSLEHFRGRPELTR